MMQRLEPNNHTRGQPPPYQWLASLRRPGRGTAVVQDSGSGSRNAQATSSDTGPAMFDSTNTMINDGHFTSHQGDHTSVTININGPRIPRTSDGILSQPSVENVVPNTDTNLNRNMTQRRNIPEENTIRPSQRSNKIYERHLMLKERGFPLWIPQPNIRLPIPYRTKGVCIGDVGIVTNFGGFDFLFNICRARDDPINPEELPDNFTPIHPPLSPIDVREFREFSSGSYLASSSIVESQTAEQIPGLTFESSASEGAILTMPEGAFQEELSNLSKFRNYVALHATDWYKFANGPRGREAQNGDLRVVVGCDKTTAWGMATFANNSSAQQSLKFRPLRSQQQPQHNSGSVYVWEHSGVAEVRVGPEPGENEELGETRTGQFRNQCLFMRTLSVTLSDSLWAATFLETVSINQEGSQPEIRDQNLGPPNPNTVKSNPSLPNPAGFVEGTQRFLEPSKSVVAQEKDNDNEESSSPIQDMGTWLRISSPRWPPSSSHGLRDIIAKRLLKPNAFVDKLYNIVNVPEAKCVTWTDSGASFIIWNVELAECFGFQHPTSFWNTTFNFSYFMTKLYMHGFERIKRIHHSTDEQTWEISHPDFIRGRPDLLHKIQLRRRRPMSISLWRPAMKHEIPSLGDAPAQLGAMQNENMWMWDNPSKIINKYMLEQIPHAKIALTHDRDWSYVAEGDFSYLNPSRLIKEVTSLNDITVDIESGVVFLEPLDEISLEVVGQRAKEFERGHITLEQYLFGSNEIRSTFLRSLINLIQFDYMAPLTGHPKRPLSLDDLIQRNDSITSQLERHCIHSLRSGLNALRLQPSGRGTWLLHLADALSRRFWHLNRKHDLEEAISYYKEAVSLLPQTHYHFLEAILGLCSTLYQRFQLLGHSDDIRELLEHLHTQLDLDLKSILAPVKAYLPRLVINNPGATLFIKSSDQMTTNNRLNVPMSPSNSDEEDPEATMFEERMEDSTSRSSRQNSQMSRGNKELESLNFLRYGVGLEPKSRSQETKGRTNDQRFPLGPSIPVQNTSLNVTDEGTDDEYDA